MKTKSKTKIKPKKLGIVITNYASGIPFWIKMDLGRDRGGKRWHLAILSERGSTIDRKIVFPMESLEYDWNAAHYAKYEQKMVSNPYRRK